MKLPRLWRKKNAAGKFVGSYRITWKGQEINLGTSDANDANARRLEAVRRGRRNFIDEIDEAAAASEPSGDPPPAAAPAAPAPAVAPAAPPPAPPAALAAAPVRPDGYLPPPSTDAQAEAEATNEAAAEGDQVDDDAAAAQEMPISDDVLDGMLETGAMLIVDLQLGMQALAIRKGLKVEPGVIPPEHPARSQAAKAWVAQLKIWFPSAVAMPPWAWALLIPAGCAVQQLATATPLKKDGPESSEPPADGADPPVQAAA
jgi:hypothetical protein